MLKWVCVCVCLLGNYMNSSEPRSITSTASSWVCLHEDQLLTGCSCFGMTAAWMFNSCVFSCFGMAAAWMFSRTAGCCHVLVWQLHIWLPPFSWCNRPLWTSRQRQTNGIALYRWGGGRGTKTSLQLLLSLILSPSSVKVNLTSSVLLNYDSDRACVCCYSNLIILTRNCVQINTSYYRS